MFSIDARIAINSIVQAQVINNVNNGLFCFSNALYNDEATHTSNLSGRLHLLISLLWEGKCDDQKNNKKINQEGN